MYNMDYQVDTGNMAPNFTLINTAGKGFELYDCKNKKTVMLFFFDHTNDRCLDMLSKIGSQYDRFKDAGAIMVPVATVKIDEGIKIKNMHNLPFEIYCDGDHTVTRNYKVGQCSSEASHVCFEIITRVTSPTLFIIDTSGIIRFKDDVAKERPDNATLMRQCQEARR
mgnify:CR=1 FL=1